MDNQTPAETIRAAKDEENFQVALALYKTNTYGNKQACAAVRRKAHALAKKTKLSDHKTVAVLDMIATRRGMKDYTWLDESA
jgi:hypothetical protein